MTDTCHDVSGIFGTSHGTVIKLQLVCRIQQVHITWQAWLQFGNASA